MPAGHLYVFLGKCLFRSSHLLIRLFGFLILSCMSCLYILDINPLSAISFANIFSHSVSCLFVLSVVSFAVQKLLSLISPHLFAFAFIFFTLGDRSKKILLRFMSKSVPPSGCTRIWCGHFFLSHSDRCDISL